MSTNEPPSAAASKPAKPPTTIPSSAVISETATLTGRHHITIGSNTVIHPRCKILSNNGPVIIGAGCIISERSVVGLSSSPAEGLSEEDESLQVIIGDGVVIEIGAKVEARIVGEGSCIGVNSHISPGVVIGKVGIPSFTKFSSSRSLTELFLTCPPTSPSLSVSSTHHFLPCYPHADMRISTADSGLSAPSPPVKFLPIVR